MFSWFTLVATLLKTSINEMHTYKWKFSSEILKGTGYNMCMLNSTCVILSTKLANLYIHRKFHKNSTRIKNS